MAKVKEEHAKDAKACISAAKPTENSHADTSDHGLKYSSKRCKDLERFQIQMGISQLYENFNPLMEYYRSLLPSKSVQAADVAAATNKKATTSDCGSSQLKSYSRFQSQSCQDKKEGTERIKEGSKQVKTDPKKQKAEPGLSGLRKSMKAEKTPDNADLHTDIPNSMKQQKISQAHETEDDKHDDQQDRSLDARSKKDSGKPRIKVIKMKQKRLVLNVSQSRYPILRKIAKFEYGFFISTRDMFAPINGQMVLDAAQNNGTALVTNGLQRDPDDDYFDIYWMDGAGQKHLDRFA